MLMSTFVILDFCFENRYYFFCCHAQFLFFFYLCMQLLLITFHVGQDLQNLFLTFQCLVQRTAQYHPLHITPFTVLSFKLCSAIIQCLYFRRIINMSYLCFRKISTSNCLCFRNYQYLCLRSHVVSSPEKRMLLFIDEIQEEPAAVAMLRYFYEKMPWLYVITAGSRLQSLLKKHVSFPVARVEYLNLRPFSFMEYINATQGHEWCDLLRNLSVPSVMHDKFMSLFNRYALIGGMPEAVADYAQYQDIERLSPIYNSLLKGYNEDVERYAKNEEQVRFIRHILDTAWFSAAESITFSNFGNSSYTSTQIHEAMDCLERAYILSLDYPVTSSNQLRDRLCMAVQ